MRNSLSRSVLLMPQGQCALASIGNTLRLFIETDRGVRSGCYRHPKRWNRTREQKNTPLGPCEVSFSASFLSENPFIIRPSLRSSRPALCCRKPAIFQKSRRSLSAKSTQPSKKNDASRPHIRYWRQRNDEGQRKPSSVTRG